MTQDADTHMPTPLQRFHGALMRQVMTRLARVFHTHQLTPAQVSALFHLRERESLLVGDLGAVLGLTSGTISHLVERLIRRELVIRVAHDGDQRQRRIGLSEAGTAFLADVDAGLQEALSSLMEPVPASLTMALDVTLVQILAALHGSAAFDVRPDPEEPACPP